MSPPLMIYIRRALFSRLWLLLSELLFTCFYAIKAILSRSTLADDYAWRCAFFVLYGWIPPLILSRHAFILKSTTPRFTLLSEYDTARIMPAVFSKINDAFSCFSAEHLMTSISALHRLLPCAHEGIWWWIAATHKRHASLTLGLFAVFH